MAVSTEELVAIIGGSLAGLIVLLIVLACIINYFCGRRRNAEKDRRFRQLSSNADTINSKQSGSNGYDPRMDMHVDPRLPKVGSTGLWVGAPSMYSKGPSDAYYIDRPKRTSSLQRASSETKLTGQPKSSGSKKKRDVSHVHVKKEVGRSNGHLVYQGGGMQPIYHSQQVPGIYQPYEIGHHRSNYIHGIYPYQYGNYRDSRAILVEYPDEQQYYHNYRIATEEDRKREGSKVKRTHSDLTGTKRKKERKRRGESPAYSGSKERTPGTAAVEVHQQRASSGVRAHNSHDRRITSSEEQSKSMEFNEGELSNECATDSAKLRAIQGNSKETGTHQWKEDLRLNIPNSDDEGERNTNYSSNIVSKMDAIMDDQGVARAYVRSENNNLKSDSGHTNAGFSHDEIKSSSTARKSVSEQDNHAEVHKKRTVERVESNTDGKQVSAAFDFLNNYLSDDEGTEHFESRNQSPTPFT